MARSMKRVRKNSSRGRGRSRSIKRGGGGKDLVGNRKADQVQFSAKLGAFLCENENIEDVVGDDSGFFLELNKKKVNQRVFGALPFLHLNISKSDFVKLLESGKVSLVNEAEKMCSDQDLEKHLEKVKFSCSEQSKVGISALNLAICESIERRWTMRQNGRKVINKIQQVQESQAKKSIIPPKSLEWTSVPKN